MRTILRRLRRRAAELTAFGAVGAVAFIVDTGGSNALHFGLGVGPLTSKALATAASVAVAYLGHRLWTFRCRDRGSAVQRYAVFLLLNAVAMGLALVCLGITRYGLGLTGPVAYNLSSNVVGLGLGSVFRYWSYRRWVFPERRGAAAAPNNPPNARPRPPV